jgi:hypothetical protein
MSQLQSKKKKRRTLADRPHDEKASTAWAATLRNGAEGFDDGISSAPAEMPPNDPPPPTTAHALYANANANAKNMPNPPYSSAVSPSYRTSPTATSRQRHRYSSSKSPAKHNQLYLPELVSPIFISPLKSYQSPGSGSGSPQTPLSPEERYQIVVDREIQRIEAQDRLFRWKHLQKIKQKNDETIGGMIANVHDLMAQYGLRPKSNTPTTSPSFATATLDSATAATASAATTTTTTTTTTSPATTTTTASTAAELAHRNRLLKSIFTAAPPGNGSVRTIQAIQAVLRAGSEHGRDRGERSAEAYMCEFLLNAGFASHDNSNGEDTRTLDEFVSIVEHTLNEAIEKEEQQERQEQRTARKEGQTGAAAAMKKLAESKEKTQASAPAGESVNSGRRRRRSLLSSNVDNTFNPLPPPSLSGLVREGWMNKLGQKNKTWKRRWFQLVAYTQRGCSLVYFTKPNGIRKGGIHMISAVAIDEIIDHLDVAEQR